MSPAFPEGDFAGRAGAAAAAAWSVLLAAGGVLLAALALISGGVREWHAPLAFCAGAVPALLAARRVWGSMAPEAFSGCRPWRAPWLDALLAALFSAAVFRAFFWVAYQDGGAVKIENISNLGDLALHLALIRHLAGPGGFWPESPIISGEPLAYPVGMDLVNAALLVSGVPWLPGLIAVGFLGGMATLAALRLWGGWFAVAGFLFNGGLAFLDFLGGANPPEAEWKSIFACMLVPQRGFLFAFPAGLLLLADARARMRGKPLLPAWAALLALAALPLFHVHTAMFAGGLLVWWAVFGRGFRTAALAGLAAAAVPWALLLFLVTGGFASRGAVHWAPGWMENGQGVWFWARNFGIYPVLVLAAIGSASVRGRGRPVWDRDGAAAARRFLIPAAMCFGAACFIGFAPWLWDNTKLMVWSYLACLPFAGAWLRRALPLAAGVVFAALIFISGAQGFWERMRQGPAGFELAVRAELAEVEALTKDLPGEGRFAAAPAFDHPLLLAGQPVALGYLGHLWSHGYDYAGRLDHLNRLMEGREGWRESAAALGVRYVFWGFREVEAYPASARPWAALAVRTSPWGNIYDLGPPPARGRSRRGGGLR